MSVNRNLVAFETEVIGLRRADAKANLEPFPSDASIPRVYGRPATIDDVFGRFIGGQVSIDPVGPNDEYDQYMKIIQEPYSDNIVDKKNREDDGLGFLSRRREYQVSPPITQKNSLKVDLWDELQRITGSGVREYVPPAYLTADYIKSLGKTPVKTETEEKAYQQSLGVNRAKYIVMGAAEALARQPSVVITTRIVPFEPLPTAE